MAGNRTELERLLAADIRALSAESEQIGRIFAGRHALSANDFRALLHIIVADNAGEPLTAGQLRQRMGLSGAAITYQVERMMEAGHIQREADPGDRRKVILRYSRHGMEIATEFFLPASAHVNAALADVPDDDLATAHRVILALIDGLQSFQDELAPSETRL